ncbi:14747_t:CDS:2 [Acaulospora morrowiae]|uniref:14747_t:CDS:1 n=1 Tax=Acaulospora morrowiae TaxID=94023 RepID=A0A9N9ASB4_9GLOM|nr:14747_t:CDS:2 [Acaulospora morrowiae]
MNTEITTVLAKKIKHQMISGRVTIPDYHKETDKASSSDVSTPEPSFDESFFFIDEDVTSQTDNNIDDDTDDNEERQIIKKNIRGYRRKEFFMDGEWDEMIKDFNNYVNLSDLEDDHKMPFYKLMDKIAEYQGLSIFIIINNFKLNSAYTHQHLRLSEALFGSNFTNIITKGILTLDQTYHYEEVEIQGFASSMITNLKKSPPTEA